MSWQGLSFLTKAARNSSELPTSQVQLLVGARLRGSMFSSYGFSFRPAGKHGQETSLGLSSRLWQSSSECSAFRCLLRSLFLSCPEQRHQSKP